MLTRFAAIALVMLAVSTPAWAADRDNVQMFRDVQREVLRYSQFTIFDSVYAEVDNGVVTLTGKVTMPYKRDDIAKRVARLTGVRTVNNRMDVLPASLFDDELRIRIARAIYGNAHFWRYGTMVNPPIHVIVERGRVTLEGVVHNNVDRMIARSIAGSFEAFSLTNNLRTDAEATAELERVRL